MGDYFDFYVCGFGKRGDLDRGAGRKIVGEIFRVDFVHTGEVAEVGQEHSAFDDVGESQFLVVQDGFYVLEDALGLSFDVAGDEVTGRWVERDLAGAKEQIADADGMVIGTDSGRGLGGFYYLFLRHK